MLHNNKHDITCYTRYLWILQYCTPCYMITKHDIRDVWILDKSRPIVFYCN